MKLYFMKQDAVDFMKHNMERLYVHYYQNDDNKWIEQEYGSDPFEELIEVPDFELAEIESGTIGEVDFENCKILYNNLRMLSESQCSDERLWAGLCNGTFYNYMRERYGYPNKQLKKKETDTSAIISRFFFSGGTRAGFYRNGLAKCWWVGRATYDRDNDNHFEKLDILGPNDLTSKISYIFFSNTFASNPSILSGICDSLKYFNDRGQALNLKKHVRAAMKYLNAVGGATLLDVLSTEEISKIMTTKILSIMSGIDDDFDYDSSDDDQLLEEINEDDDIEDISYRDIVSDPEDGHSEGDDNYLDIIQTEQTSWLDEIEIDKSIIKPNYISYGCWVKVLIEKENKEKTIHIPLKGDISTKMYPIHDKLLGKEVGDRFIFGKNGYYIVLDFGFDDL